MCKLLFFSSLLSSLLYSSGSYRSEIDCARTILTQDGLQGLVLRGIDATILREIPGYALYFVIYHELMQAGSPALGSFAPLLCGAAAGCLSWIPVYPIDVVKT